MRRPSNQPIPEVRTFFSGLQMRAAARFPLAVFAFLFLLLLPSTTTFSQVPALEWQRNYGGTGNDEGECILQTSDGGYIIAGWTSSNNIDVSGNHSANETDCWVVKVDAVGNIQWQKTVGGTRYEDALSIKETRDGGYIVCGHTISSDGDLSANHGDSYDVLVFKLDNSGNLLWAKNYGGNGYDAALSIEETPDGGYIFAGYTESNNQDVSGNHGSYDAWVVKLDVNGNIQWQKCIGGSSRDYAWAVKPTPDGGYVIAGYTDSNNGDISLNRGSFDIMVAKLDASGNLQWLNTFGGSAEEWALDIVNTTGGGFLVAGYTFSGNGNVSVNRGRNDVWILKLNASGILQWEKTYGGSNYEDPYAIEETSDGGFVVGGRTLSVDGDVTTNYGQNDYWIIKCDVTGGIQWQKTLGGSLQDIGHSIKETQDGGFVIAGTSYSNDGDVTANYGRSDIWVVKLGPCILDAPATPGAIGGYPAPCSGTSVIYSVAPVPNAIGYNWQIPDGWTLLSGQGTNQVALVAGENPGQISVLAYNNCKSSPRSTLNVSLTSLQQYTVAVSPDVGTDICTGDDVVFTATMTGTATVDYQWKKNGLNVGQNSSVYSDDNLQSGDIITCEFHLLDICGGYTITSSPVVMTVSSLVTPTVSISGTAARICQGREVVFTATATNGGASAVYTWYVNNTDMGVNAAVFRTTTLSDGDIVSCMLTSDIRCVTTSNAISNLLQIEVDVNTVATVNITASRTTICKEDEVTFTAETTNAGTSPTYKWLVNGAATGDNTRVLVARNFSNGDEVSCVVTPGTNTCAVNNASSNTIRITINPLPEIVIFPADTLVTPGAQVTFDTYVSLPVNSFEWTPSAMLVAPSLPEPTTVPVFNETIFRFQVVTNDGCRVYKDVRITPLIPLYIPSAFTPNGDGLNDLFRIPAGSNIILADFSVFNRWGERIFTTKDAGAGWDGRVKGVMQESGVYIYSINGTQYGKPVAVKGTVTLVR